LLSFSGTVCVIACLLALATTSIPKEQEKENVITYYLLPLRVKQNIKKDGSFLPPDQDIKKEHALYHLSIRAVVPSLPPSGDVSQVPWRGWCVLKLRKILKSLSFTNHSLPPSCSTNVIIIVNTSTKNDFFSLLLSLVYTLSNHPSLPFQIEDFHSFPLLQGYLFSPLPHTHTRVPFRFHSLFYLAPT